MAKFTQQVGKDGKKQPFYKCPNDKVRVEQGPQIIKLDATPANLDNGVTSAHYQVGAKDAHGHTIGEQKHMHCVDWRCVHAPKLWKIYQSQGDGNFAKVAEFEDLAEAISAANDFIEGAA